MNVRRPRAPGATLMSKQFPHPQCHSARLRRLGYVPPIWHRALRRAPPKDMYPLKRVSGPLNLPGDKVVRKVFQKIPMLRKERYEQFNVDYQPLATRIALTQMRLQREGMEEEEAFNKCERDIFKDELYFFAKNIRDSPGNHFKLTSDELRSFYIHDLINEAQMLKKRVNVAVNDNLSGPVKTALAEQKNTTEQQQQQPQQTNNKSLKKQATDRIAQDTIAQYLIDSDPLIEDVMQERGVGKVFVNPFHRPYKMTGKWEPHKTTIPQMFHPEFNVDDVLLYRHGSMYQENQRYLKSTVQVPASAFIDAINFGDDETDCDGMEFDKDEMFSEDMMRAADTHHFAKDNSTYFTIQEGLTNRQFTRDENEMDKRIAVMLMKQDKAAAKAEKAQKH